MCTLCRCNCVCVCVCVVQELEQQLTEQRGLTQAIARQGSRARLHSQDSEDQVSHR